MEWNQLHCFLVAAEEENFSRAAEILHVAQPSLSQTIKRFEEELGYPLFHREGRRVRLNENGKIWQQTATQMEELYRNTRLRLEEANGVLHPEVSINIGCGSALVPDLLRFLRNRNPGIQYKIHQWNITGDDRKKDICILAEPDSKDRLHADYGELSVLIEEPICLVIPEGHRLLELDEISIRDLEREEFISLNDSWSLYRDIAEEMKRLHFTPNITMRIDNPNLLRELIRSHMGIAFAPAVTWKPFVGKEVFMRPVKECKMKRYVYLKTPDRSVLTREQKECIKGIREFFAQLL